MQRTVRKVELLRPQHDLFLLIPSDLWTAVWRRPKGGDALRLADVRLWKQVVTFVYLLESTRERWHCCHWRSFRDLRCCCAPQERQLIGGRTPTALLPAPATQTSQRLSAAGQKAGPLPGCRGCCECPALSTVFACVARRPTPVVPAFQGAVDWRELADFH